MSCNHRFLTLIHFPESSIYPKKPQRKSVKLRKLKDEKFRYTEAKKIESDATTCILFNSTTFEKKSEHSKRGLSRNNNRPVQRKNSEKDIFLALFFAMRLISWILQLLCYSVYFVERSLLKLAFVRDCKLLVRISVHSRCLWSLNNCSRLNPSVGSSRISKLLCIASHTFLNHNV